MAAANKQGGHPAGQWVDVVAIVEFEDGEVQRVPPEKIRFAFQGAGGIGFDFFPKNESERAGGQA